MKNYKLIKIISFLFPIVGLIIFALNIKNDSNLAKISGKYALLGIIIIPVMAFIILTIFYGAYRHKINDVSSSIKIPVANININSSQLITEDMIDYIEISKANIKDNILKDKKEIVGKYTSYTCTIPQGSMFYRDCLIDALP